jgi:hypothetical protein
VPKSKIILLLDNWSNTNKHSFLGVITHYITAKYELVKEMIGFKSLIDYYLGAALTIIINSILEKYNLLD